jgi:ABC-2 type transport system permease protein
MNAISPPLTDSRTMLRRNLKHILRNPVLLFNAALMPVVLMLLLVYVFGDAFNVGEHYVEYATPGLIVLAICYGLAGTAVSVNSDMTKGIINRFKVMNVSRGAVLTGHVVTTMLTSAVAIAVIIGMAFALGFRSSATPLDRLGAIGIAAAAAFAAAWLTVALGMAAKTPESAGLTVVPLLLLPFVSSAVVPAAKMGQGIRQFAQYQPFAPIIESLRGLLAGIRQGQRLDQPQRLTGDAERFPAGREDPQPPALAKHSIGERRRRLDHVLAVVQDQQRLPLADRGDEPVRQLRVRRLAEQGVPEAESGQCRLRRVTGGADGGELHQPGPVRQVAEQRARGLRGQPGLARAARPGQGGEPMSGDEFADRRDISVPADEAGQLGSQVGLPSFLAPPQLHQVGQFRHQLAAVAEADLRVEPILHGSQAQPLEPGDRRVERGAVLQTDALHGRTAPQCEGLAQQPHPPGIGIGAGLADEAFEPRRVGGRALTPNPVDQRCLRDYVTRFEREGDQQPAQSGARHVGQDAVVRANLERPKHPDLHLADSATGAWRSGRRRLRHLMQPGDIHGSGG